MKYQNVIAATFLSRPNRFIAYVDINGAHTLTHVKNTGRCKELLVPGCRVYLAFSDNPARKTQYDLIAVEKALQNEESLLINMDSQIVNDVVDEWLRSGGLFSPNATIRREISHGTSRFDFYVEDGERKVFLEVKGVTLESDGIARFPDAPTERGVKHVRELISCVNAGYEAYIIFVVQMKGIRYFCPNDDMQPVFGEVLREAKQKGVNLLAFDCLVERDSISLDHPIPIKI